MREALNAELGDRYTIERQLGRGGMASVWLARDLRHDRMVAIKVMHPELAAAIGVDRFLREIRFIAKLQHPNIIPLLDSGVLPSATGVPLPWYGMGYIAGESLRDRLDRERHLPVETALAITEAVASALSTAHHLGIVHRDIKPENVLLADGQVYVADFGIAKALIETGGETLTSTGLAIGTPSYMSPEQAMGEAIDARSDQYSLATMLYEMLAGEPPFTGPTAQAVVARRMAERPRGIRPVRSVVSEGLEQAVFRGLERVPADRFPDVMSFAQALRHGGVVTSSRSPRRISLLFAVAVLLLAFGLGARKLWSRKAGPDPATVALYTHGLKAYDRRTPEGAAEAIRDFKAALARDTSYAPAWAGLARTYVRAFERRFVFPGMAGDSVLHLAVLAGDRAMALDSRSAVVWTTQANVSRLLDPTDVAPAIRSARHAIGLDSSYAPAWHFLAISLAEAGQFEAAMEAWRRSVTVDPGYVQGLAFMGLGFYWRRQFDSAWKWADSTVAVEPTYLLGRSTIAQVALERGDYVRSIGAADAARRVSSDIETVNTLAYRALAEARSGAVTKARATLAEAESLAASYQPVPLHTAVYLGQVYVALHNTAKARDWLRRYSPSADLHFQLHLRCDPPFDPLENDPGFKALLVMPRPKAPAGC